MFGSLLLQNTKKMGFTELIVFIVFLITFVQLAPFLIGAFAIVYFCFEFRQEIKAFIQTRLEKSQQNKDLPKNNKRFWLNLLLKN